MDYEMDSHTIHNSNTIDTNSVMTPGGNISDVTEVITTPSVRVGAAWGTGSEKPDCFYFDLCVKVLLNTILAVIGLIGNRYTCSTFV